MTRWWTGLGLGKRLSRWLLIVQYLEVMKSVKVVMISIAEYNLHVVM